MNASHFIVARDDLKQSKFIETALPEGNDLPDDSLLVKVERFAFTANNITYALAGDQLKYWHLFPIARGGRWLAISPSFGNNRFYANTNPISGVLAGSPSTDRGQQ